MINRNPDQIRQAASGLASARIGLGLLALTAPRLTRRLLGFGGPATAEGRLGFALFGIREVVVGATVIAAVRDGYPSASLLRLNAACDAADAVVLARAARRERSPLAVLALPVSACVAAVWIWLARGLEYPDPLAPESV